MERENGRRRARNLIKGRGGREREIGRRRSRNTIKKVSHTVVYEQ